MQDGKRRGLDARQPKFGLRGGICVDSETGNASGNRRRHKCCKDIRLDLGGRGSVLRLAVRLEIVAVGAVARAMAVFPA